MLLPISATHIPTVSSENVLTTSATRIDAPAMEAATYTPRRPKSVQ